jgi:hypothetical protein
MITSIIGSCFAQWNLPYTFSYGWLMRLLFALSLTALLGTATMAQVRYFPKGLLSDNQELDEFRVGWYSTQLNALEEPSLWESSKTQRTQSYRFLWLRTFHHPIAIRIDVNTDGTSRLTTEMTSGAGGYAPGKLIENHTVTMSKEQTDWFLGKIEEHKFWKLPSVEDTRGLDGAQWIIEGIKDGSYNIVDRWSPKDGDVRALGLIMVNDLAKLKLPFNEVY